MCRPEHAIAQTREFQCTKVVLPQVIGRGEIIIYLNISFIFMLSYIIYLGLNVTEVGHDMQAQVSKYVTETLQLINSYDTWHGTLQLLYVIYIYIYICTYLIRYKECS